MDFVRKITHSDALKHIVDLPENLRDEDVELIILPVQSPCPDQEQKLPYISGSSVKGALRHYAKQHLLQHEKDAWQKSVQEKHGGYNVPPASSLHC